MAIASEKLEGDTSDGDEDSDEFKLEPIALSQMDWIGFDLDHTLVRYNLEELLPLVYRCICTYLIEHAGISSQVFDVPYDFAFCERGIVFDSRTGDLLKLDAMGRVRRACHGYCRTEKENRVENSRSVIEMSSGHYLSDDEISERYGCDEWRGLVQLRDDWRAEDAVIWATLFEIPACQVSALLVDLADRKGNAADAYAEILPSIRKALHEVMKWQNFINLEGGYFSAVASAPTRFVLPRENVHEWLKDLRQQNGKKLFLLTNSNWDYADVVMTVAFGERWRDLFDLLVYRASKKSAFFNHDRPFLPFDRETESTLTACRGNKELKAVHAAGCHEFIEGNLRDLSALFGEDAEVVYFGDDLHGDIAVTHQCSSWHSVAVVEELAQHTSEKCCWGPILSFSPDMMEPRRSCSVRQISAEVACESDEASHILEMLAATADFTVPDLAILAKYPIDNPFEHGDVLMGGEASRQRRHSLRSLMSS